MRIPSISVKHEINETINKAGQKTADVADSRYFSTTAGARCWKYLLTLGLHIQYRKLDTEKTEVVIILSLKTIRRYFSSCGRTNYHVVRRRQTIRTMEIKPCTDRVMPLSR